MGGRHPPPFEPQRFDRFAVANLDAHVLRDPGHRRRNRAAAADRVIDAVFVFQEREDRKQARATEWRHAKVFRLERECQPDPLVTEETAEFRIEALPRLEQRHQFEQVGVGEIPPAFERLFQKRRKPGEFLPGGLHEPGEGTAILRREFRDLHLHPLDVGSGQQFTTGAEHKAILRVETDHLHLPPQVIAAGREDVVENLGIEEEGWPEIEAESLGRGDRAGASSRDRKAFENANPHSRLCQQHGGGQPAGAGTDNIDSPRHPHPSVACSQERPSVRPPLKNG